MMQQPVAAKRVLPDGVTTTMLQKCRLLFAGHVQGVGFRYTTAQLAKGYDVVGTVRNLEDGRVELIVEGEKKEINQLLTALRNHFDGSIRDETSETLPVTGQFTNFEIVY